jgi:translation elongation factor EF-G
MTWRPIYCAILLSDPKMLEPLMSFECKVPSEYVSAVITMLNKRRGKILDMPSEDDIITVKAEMPISESFGIADELRGSTSGRAFWATQFRDGHTFQNRCRQTQSRRSVNAEDYRSPANTRRILRERIISNISFLLYFVFYFLKTDACFSYFRFLRF